MATLARMDLSSIIMLMLLRKRMNQIGIIGDGDSGSSEKAESRRQKRIQEKVKQLEAKGEKRGFLDNVDNQIMQAGLNIGPGTYFIFSLPVA